MAREPRTSNYSPILRGAVGVADVGGRLEGSFTQNLTDWGFSGGCTASTYRVVSDFIQMNTP